MMNDELTAVARRAAAPKRLGILTPNNATIRAEIIDPLAETFCPVRFSSSSDRRRTRPQA
jgi:hypothetical protein